MKTPETYSYEYPRPGVAADCAVFGFDGGQLLLLLIQRGQEPFRGSWALPGGFLRPGESAETAALRELEEEAGLSGLYLEQLYTFSRPDRDPRGWVISVGYVGLVRSGRLHYNGGSDACAADWFPLGELPPLAFDHKEIAGLALERIRNKIRYKPVGFELLDEQFSLPQLQALYESILGQKIDRRNFWKKIGKTGLLCPQGSLAPPQQGRPARLYSFNKELYDQLSKKGFVFEL